MDFFKVYQFQSFSDNEKTLLDSNLNSLHMGPAFVHQGSREGFQMISFFFKTIYFVTHGDKIFFVMVYVLL